MSSCLPQAYVLMRAAAETAAAAVAEVSSRSSTALHWPFDAMVTRHMHAYALVSPQSSISHSQARVQVCASGWCKRLEAHISLLPYPHPTPSHPPIPLPFKPYSACLWECVDQAATSNIAQQETRTFPAPFPPRFEEGHCLSACLRLSLRRW